MGLLDSLKGAWQSYQGALPEWATQDYNIIPDKLVNMLPDNPGPWNPRAAGDFWQDMTAVNPSIDVPLAIGGGGIGMLAKKFGGPMAMRLARAMGKGDDVGQYMGHAKPSGIGPPGRDPLGGFGDNAAETIRGNIDPPTRLGDDLRAMDAMEELGPDDFANYDDWMDYQDRIALGPDPEAALQRADQWQVAHPYSEGEEAWRNVYKAADEMDRANPRIDDGPRIFQTDLPDPNNLSTQIEAAVGKPGLAEQAGEEVSRILGRPATAEEVMEYLYLQYGDLLGGVPGVRGEAFGGGGLVSGWHDIPF